MQGSERFDREFLDATDLWHLVPEGSVYRFLAENRRCLFTDEMFADLFGPRGRPSVPGPVIAAVMVLQALECLSDREAVQRLRRDIAWKAAAGLSLAHGGFHPTVLTLWRARLRASEKPERVFDAVRQVVTESGVLASRDRRALDSTILGRRGCYRGHGDDDLSADKALPTSDPRTSRPGVGSSWLANR